MAYNANTNFANERKYLNNLISGGGGNAEWAKNQMKELNSAEQKYGNSGGVSGGGSSGSRSGGSRWWKTGGFAAWSASETLPAARKRPTTRPMP